MSIYKKLLEFHKLGISIKKDASNPHFKSKYADLSEVISKVRPALTQSGITLIQRPTENGLETILFDGDDDTHITGFLPFIGASDPQKLGSNLTYLRRYSLVTMLGLEDDDDDANTATAQKTLAKPVAKPTPTMTIVQAFVLLRKAATMDELKAAYKALPAVIQKDNEVVAVKDEMKEKITNTNA